MKNIQIKVGVIVFNNRKEILLIRERYGPEEPYRWNVIKGTYAKIPGKIPKESIFEAAIRECQEEAGIKVKLIRFIGNTNISTREKERIQFNFLAQTLSKSPKLSNKQEQARRKEDIKDIKWFSKKEIDKMQPAQFMSS